MRITFDRHAHILRQRLRKRLDEVALLLCPVHGQPVAAVTIHGLENGWFDSTWTICCEAFEKQAGAIVLSRC